MTRFNLAALTLAIAMSPCALAQDAAPAQPLIDLDDPAPSTDAAPAAEGDAPSPEAEAATDAEQLEALVIGISGRGGRWLAPGSQTWKTAAVDDVLPVGAVIDTGLRGEVALRVGRNATLLVDSASRVTLATIEQDGGRLVTHAVLTWGAADFKVDHVGLENDFVVITPSSTLAVKGTTLRVVHGPMRGTQVEGARANRVNSIEVNYFDIRMPVRLSGGGQSSTGTPSPALAALNKTVAPPPSTTPSDPAPANAQDTAQTQTVRNTQTVAIETASFAALLTTLRGDDVGGVPPRVRHPNPGYSGSPSGGPGPANGIVGGTASPSNGPRPGGAN